MHVIYKDDQEDTITEFNYYYYCPSVHWNVQFQAS